MLFGTLFDCVSLLKVLFLYIKIMNCMLCQVFLFSYLCNQVKFLNFFFSPHPSVSLKIKNTYDVAHLFISSCNLIHLFVCCLLLLSISMSALLNASSFCRNLSTTLSENALLELLFKPNELKPHSLL